MDTELQIDPDLQALINAWTSLPAAVRVGIIAMVNAAKGTQSGGGAT